MAFGNIELSEECEDDVGSKATSSCRCGIDPNDAQPGVRPWTLFVHVPRKNISNIAIIISSNMIIITNSILFDPMGKFDPDTPGVYPYYEGSKEIDISNIKVTQTSSPDSQSYKVVGIEVSRRFVESHPEDTSPPVDMAAIIVDHNFASGEGPKWPICLPKSEHIGSVNQISPILPDGVSNDEKVDIRTVAECNKERTAAGVGAIWSPEHWEEVCVNPKINHWMPFGANSIPATYKDGNKHYIYGMLWVHSYWKNSLYYQYFPNIKYAKPRLEELVKKPGSQLCSE